MSTGWILGRVDGQLSPDQERLLADKVKTSAFVKDFQRTLQEAAQRATKAYQLPAPNPAALGQASSLHQHILTLEHTSKTTYQNGQWYCDGRGAPAPFKCPSGQTVHPVGFTFRCRQCSFDLCGTCMAISTYPPEGQHRAAFYQDVVRSIMEDVSEDAVAKSMAEGLRHLDGVCELIEGASTRDELVARGTSLKDLLRNAYTQVDKASQLTQAIIDKVNRRFEAMTAQLGQLENHARVKERESAEWLRKTERSRATWVFDKELEKQCKEEIQEFQREIDNLHRQIRAEESSWNPFSVMKSGVEGMTGGGHHGRISYLRAQQQCRREALQEIGEYKSQYEPHAIHAKEEAIKADFAHKNALIAQKRLSDFMTYLADFNQTVKTAARSVAGLCNALDSGAQAAAGPLDFTLLVGPLTTISERLASGGSQTPTSRIGTGIKLLNGGINMTKVNGRLQALAKVLTARGQEASQQAAAVLDDLF